MWIAALNSLTVQRCFLVKYFTKCTVYELIPCRHSLLGDPLQKEFKAMSFQIGSEWNLLFFKKVNMQLIWLCRIFYVQDGGHDEVISHRKCWQPLRASALHKQQRPPATNSNSVYMHFLVHSTFVHVNTASTICLGGDWKSGTGHLETIKIVGTDIARLDNAAFSGLALSIPAIWCRIVRSRESRCPPLLYGLALSCLAMSSSAISASPCLALAYTLCNC